MEPPLKRWSRVGLRLLVGGVFVVAGTLKAAEPGAFLTSIENYQILPHMLAVAAAFYLPFLEILCGGCLILRRCQAGALALLGGMLLVFITALVIAWGRGLNIACGCFGDGGEPGRYGLELSRDLVLLGAVGWLWWRERE
ncbi:MAG: hypothetical protein PHQ12_06055 [Chthoniobacteraceae bacterium]|nr:hypothetical protein [Chthoniobacteraceae bacterium]